MSTAEVAAENPPFEPRTDPEAPNSGRSTLPGIDNYQQNVRTLQCKVEVAPGCFIRASVPDTQPETIFLDTGQYRGPSWNVHWGTKLEEVEPFIQAEIVGTAYHRQVVKGVRVNKGNRWSTRYVTEQQTVTSSYELTNRYCYETHRHIRTTAPYNYVMVKVTRLDTGYEQVIEVAFQRPFAGRISVNRRTRDDIGVTGFKILHTFFGLELEWEWSFKGLSGLQRAFKELTLEEPRPEFWDDFLGTHRTRDNIPLASVKSLWKRKAIKPNLDRLEAEEPLLFRFLLWLHNDKNRKGNSNNKLIGTWLRARGDNYDHIKADLQAAMLRAEVALDPEERKNLSWEGPHENSYICLGLFGANEKVEEKRAKEDWRFQKGNENKAVGLGISPERHPKLMAAVKAGNIPLGCFHEPGEDTKLVNIEFDLWERALARKGWAEVLFEIAQNASRRNTYTRRMTSYIGFLFTIERYLDRHATRRNARNRKVPWQAMPKYVKSQWELEMDDEAEEQTTKRRSALTPVADNEAGTITVPYAAMSVSGVRTTWCYSDMYFVAEEGLNDPLGSGIFPADLVEKLNGRDDYGYMTYTLSGTARNRGYPTFLIIFERTTEHGTRVHFHRVHPCRKKKGIATPSCRLIEECYRYMAGNVRAETIYAQQGDIILVKAERVGDKVEEAVPVFAFEDHKFVSAGEQPVMLSRSTAKTRGNLMGWLVSEQGFSMPHPEHENIDDIEAGIYEVRRCKSYENNPKSVWVLTID